MKVTKGKTEVDAKKVVAFYTGVELVFRDIHSNENYCISSSDGIHKGTLGFDSYLGMSRSNKDFIAFYEGDTIIIEL